MSLPTASASFPEPETRTFAELLIDAEEGVTTCGARGDAVLERAVQGVSEQAAKADDLMTRRPPRAEAITPFTVHAKMLRPELLKVKGELERSLGELVLDCSKCGQTVLLGRRLGASVVHWLHREPAPHGEPSV
jgi:hypothetical protein